MSADRQYALVRTLALYSFPYPKLNLYNVLPKSELRTELKLFYIAVI